MNDAPSGLDDIVCIRSDGIKDFWQIKWTPSPQKTSNQLSWEWLLKINGKTSRARSIFQKLHDAFEEIPPDQLGMITLLTNKCPSRDMDLCLNNKKINFEEIKKETQAKIISQIGTRDKILVFLSQLTIQHTDHSLKDLQRIIKDGFLNFSDEAGFNRLCSRSREWAIHKHCPSESGWIEIQHVKEVLSTLRPKAIPEMFSVSNDYCLPCLDFHNMLREKIINSKGEVITLTGKPGFGKSTYLSYLCQELNKLDIPLVRHHYFLSAGDSTEDRISSRIVTESLIHQINNLNSIERESSADESLSDVIGRCAHYYKKQNKPLVILIDGLDHVWRDNLEDTRPLDDIFKHILPERKNVVVLIGTQQIDDRFLPNSLLTASPMNTWHSIPPMSPDSICNYIKKHVESKRFFLNCHNDEKFEEIKKCANVLQKSTQGYPLYLVYLSEYIANNRITLNSYEINQLNFPKIDRISDYYTRLWNRLTYKQQAVLHLTCGFQFAWPRSGISQVIHDDHDNAPSINKVTHLLTEDIAGVRPFHESLIVFVKNHNTHQERIQAMLHDVCKWLNTNASIYLKNNWLWYCLAKNGDSLPLREGVTRDWILNNLITGMPIDSCVRLLSEAERYSFQDLCYHEAYYHRNLKYKLINGPDYQIYDKPTLETLSLISSDNSTLNEIVSRRNEYSAIKLATVSMAMFFRNEYKTAIELSCLAIKRFREERKIQPSESSYKNELEFSTLIKSTLLTDTLNYKDILTSGRFIKWPDDCINSFLSACLIKKDISIPLYALNHIPKNTTIRGKIEFTVIRLAFLENIDITCHPEYKQLSFKGLLRFFNRGCNSGSISVKAGNYLGNAQDVFHIGSKKDYHSWFFRSLSIKISASGDFTWIPIIIKENRADISFHYYLLNKLADDISNIIMTTRELTFDLVCSLFPSEINLNPALWEIAQANKKLKKTWLQIATDLHLMTRCKKVSAEGLGNVLSIGLFNSDLIRSWYRNLEINLFSIEAVDLLIEHELNRQKKEIEETSQSSIAYLDLSYIANMHGKNDLFKKYLKISWDFVLGYEYHKDMTAYETLEAVRHLSTIDPSESLKILQRISPIIFSDRALFCL